MELYLFAALLVAILYGFEIVGEKLFIEDEPNVTNHSLVFISVGFLAVFGILILPFTPIKLALTHTEYAIFLITGLIYTTSMALWFYAIERENASKVGQLASLESVVTAMFGIIIFNETPSDLSILGIILVVLSIFILVFDRGLARAIITTKLAVLPILLCVFLWAIQDSIINYIASDINFWTIYFWIRLTSFLFFLPLLFKKTIRTNLKQVLTTNTTHLTTFFAAKFATAIAIVLSIYAIAYGPLSIVAPVLASYPIFTLIFGLIATKITTHEIETATKTHVIKRTLSLTIFIIGIAILFQA